MIILDTPATHPENGEAIKVMIAYKEHVKPGSCFGPAIHNLYLIECCTEGCGSVIINGKEFPVKAGDAYVLMPDDAIRHTSDTVNPRVGYSCGIRGRVIETYIKEAGITSQSPFVDPDAFKEICTWMEQLIHYWPQKDAGARLRQLGCVYGLLGVILRDKRTAVKSNLIDRAIGYMETNYGYPLTVAEIAKAVGLEQSYLSVLFKSKTGISPYRYLIRLRIQKACQLLLMEKYSISEVADLVGLDSHNFSRIFAREMGTTPTVYLSERIEKAT